MAAILSRGDKLNCTFVYEATNLGHCGRLIIKKMMRRLGLKKILCWRLRLVMPEAIVPETEMSMLKTEPGSDLCQMTQRQKYSFSQNTN